MRAVRPWSSGGREVSWLGTGSELIMQDSPASESDFLVGMATASTARCAAARKLLDDAHVLKLAESQVAAHPLVLSKAGFDLIAEVKRSSSSAGKLATDDLSPPDQGARYRDAGAVAISVLTEPSRFAGELKHLTAVAERVAPVPAMRKDFLVSPYQVIEARAAGASGVLLIAAMLEASVLHEMLQTARDLGLFVLVEAFDEADLNKCLPIMSDAGPACDPVGTVRQLIGINCRDLRTLKVDFPRFGRLASQLPADIPRVAESGVETSEQAAAVAGLGYGLALIGTALMRARDPQAAADQLLSAGRAVRASR